MQAEVNKWMKRDCRKLRTLPGLMQLLQAEARPEADQPEVIPGIITTITLIGVLFRGWEEGRGREGDRIALYAHAQKEFTRLTCLDGCMHSSACQHSSIACMCLPGAWRFLFAQAVPSVHVFAEHCQQLLLRRLLQVLRSLLFFPTIAGISIFQPCAGYNE